jgi:hypothetical protein
MAREITAMLLEGWAPRAGAPSADASIDRIEARLARLEGEMRGRGHAGGADGRTEGSA